MLPHVYEGQGPEHSSARIERFLQMCDQDLDHFPSADEIKAQVQLHNLQVVNCSTPAQLFHVLRRQLHREFRKPLIVMTPKSLLRHPLCKSPITAFDDVGDDVRFARVIEETDKDLVPPEQIKRVLFCSGKVYYDLYEERKKKSIKDVAIVRVEQLSPFPFDKAAIEVQKYSKAEIAWVQEEPKNSGAWMFIYFALTTTLKHFKDARQLTYIGRPASASPAVGSAKAHVKEVASLLAMAFAL